MTIPGVTTLNLGETAVSDAILVNREGTTLIQPTSALATQLASDGPVADRLSAFEASTTSTVNEALQEIGSQVDALAQTVEGAAEGYVVAALWTTLEATAGTRVGQPGRVVSTDPGTHVDPGTGLTVPNSGEYAWGTGPNGWRRIGNLELQKVVVPLFDDMAHDFADEAGISLGGIDRKGRLVGRDENGQTFKVTPNGTATAPTAYDVVWDSAGTGNATVRPNDGRLRMLPVYGQSYSMGAIDAADYAAAAPYNGVAFDSVFGLMPSVGVNVDTNFTNLTGLLEQKNGNGATVETICSEWVKGIHDGWAAAGLAKAPIVSFVGGEGGRPVQYLMPGSARFEAFMLKIQRTVTAARAMGFAGVVCDAVCYLQGQDNRSMPQTMTRHEWARVMATLQAAFDRRIRAITGQMEPVVMLVESISRGAKPAEISLGAALAAQRSPGRIVLLNPDYALEHSETSEHPSVAGYRRLGRFAAKATLGTVFGLDYRPMLVRRHWMHDATHLRIEIEKPKGSTLVKDESDALVKKTGLDAGAGIRAYDKNGAVTISSAAVVANHAAANADICGTIEVTFAAAPDANSLVAQYANERPPGSGPGQGGLGGSVSGPRGLFRADGGYDADMATDLAAPVNSWVQPFEIY